MVFTVLYYKNLEPLLELDDYLSAIWNNKYFTAGNFEIICRTTNERILKLVRNNFITLNLTNSVTFYQVETAFGSYSVGDYIGLEDFALLSETDKAKCFSAIVTVNFNPANLQLDMTTNSYLHRLANSQKTVALSGYNYVYEYQFKVPATSSEKIIFYKSDNTQDYSYPNNNNSSAVNVSVKLAGETS